MTAANPDNWHKLLSDLDKNALPDDRSMIKIENLERVLAKFRIKIHPKQRETIKKLYGVLFAGDPSIINIQPLLDVEKNRQTDDIYGKVEMEESNEELKADLGGYFGDFHRHRVDKSIRKRVSLSEKELGTMLLENNRLKEIALSIRHIDPDRNGFVT